MSDWFTQGKTAKHFKYPPSIPSVEEIEPFIEGLKEIVPLKIKEATKRQNRLKRLKKELLTLTLKMKRQDRWFGEELTVSEFHEHDVITKWLQYWLAIWDTVNNKKETKITLKFSQWEIDYARQKSFQILLDTRNIGNKQVALCPFHNEKTPSFVIFPDDYAHCYGCGWHGDNIKFLMEHRKLTFKEAIQQLLWI